MGGPTASVLLPTPLADANATAWAQTLDACGERRAGHDIDIVSTLPLGGRYHGDQRPFGITVDTPPEWRYFSDSRDIESDASAIESAVAQIVATFGWVPQQQVWISAYCNGSVDHLILAELALALARQCAGLISFNGALTIGWQPTLAELGAPLDWPAVRPSVEPELARIGGTICAVLDAAQRNVTHVCDAAFLARWMQHPQFHMIK